MIVSLAVLLVPLSIAGLESHGYRTPWIIALMVIGGVGIFGVFSFPLYEGTVAAHPVFPLRYAKHRAISLAFLIHISDAMSAAASHGYLYHVLTFFSGMVFGLVIWKTRTYKWWVMAGCVIRAIGYGVMFRVRRGDPNMAEIFTVQIVEGVGDGIVQIGGYVAATINVPYKETAQMTALIDDWHAWHKCRQRHQRSHLHEHVSGKLAKELSSLGTSELISNVFNSITIGLPAWGTPERIAIITAVSLAIIVPCFAFVFFLPNQKLNNAQNLLEDHGMLGASQQVVIQGHAAHVENEAPEGSELRHLK